MKTIDIELGNFTEKKDMPDPDLWVNYLYAALQTSFPRGLTAGQNVVLIKIVNKLEDSKSKLQSNIEFEDTEFDFLWSAFKNCTLLPLNKVMSLALDQIHSRIQAVKPY